jgi:hypothetical protein
MKAFIHTLGSKMLDWPERTNPPVQYPTENVVTVVEHDFRDYPPVRSDFRMIWWFNPAYATSTSCKSD